MSIAEKDSSSMWLGERKVLSALLEHPYADPFWLGEYLGSRTYTTTALQSLKRRGYAHGFQFSRGDLALKRVWTITQEGVNALAQLRRVPKKLLAREYAFQRGRLAWMVLAMGRVTPLRWWMKTLEGFNPPHVGRRNVLALKPLPRVLAPLWKWQVVAWNEEIEAEGKVGKYAQRVGFTGGVSLSHRETGRWLRLLIHVDDPNVDVSAQREHFTRWLMLQKDSRYFDNEGNLVLPTLAVIAQNDYRLNEYATMFRQIALRYHLILPSIYLALDETIKAARGNPTQPIWYNINSGENRILLADERGFAGKISEHSWHPILARVKRKDGVVVAAASGCEPPGIQLDELAATTLTLKDTDHKLVRLVAAHPLLSAKELEQLTNLYQSQIATSLQRLSKLGIVERNTVPAFEILTGSAEIEMDKRKLQRKREIKYYITTELGERYLAAVDGFGTALARYRQVKLWSPEQTKRLVMQWAHTRLGNMLFVKLACAVRARGGELEWHSEPESRLYFSLNSKRYAFLPDGRGVLRIGDARIHFVVEIDAARSNADKMRRKIARYYAGVVARILPENPGETLRILIVTHSAERMNHLLEIAREIQSEMDPTRSSLRRVAPILFGQQQMIVNPRETIDRPNWIDLDGRRAYCFPQFEPVLEPPDGIGTGRVIYKS